jgi:hypothetical protein
MPASLADTICGAEPEQAATPRKAKAAKVADVKRMKIPFIFI